ncbi:uncharacterized protein LOC109809173 [Cajanus cajan]|uniref:Uncharacterized protein n=1 Tax=Cajanus cajan TaxID=3821 RepID=A0A151SLS6_CAJCA|nr:uncharacterized protein LOC109809173 [Cajanus cajan]KYP55699.1 hypothetical protein KK1_001923 [Cajanus cajan]
MSSMISAQGVAVATAMAVSGTVILLALRLQKGGEFPLGPPVLRSCISSGGKKSKKKKKKRVHFAEDVVESCRDAHELRTKIHSFNPQTPSNSNGPPIPPNRLALYNGMLRDRLAQRLAFSC